MKLLPVIIYINFNFLGPKQNRWAPGFEWDPFNGGRPVSLPRPFFLRGFSSLREIGLRHRPFFLIGKVPSLREIWPSLGLSFLRKEVMSPLLQGHSLYDNANKAINDLRVGGFCLGGYTAFFFIDWLGHFYVPIKRKKIFLLSFFIL